MNLFNKTAPWVVASLLAATSAFGQSNTKCPPAQDKKSFEQGHELMQNQMMAAYNAPARIDVRGAWDFYATGSFLYWQPVQENMELGISNDISRAGLVAGTAGPVDGNWINMKFDYKPAFKFGLGMNFDHDNWDTYAEYTWFRSTQHQSSSTSTGTIIPAFGSPALMIANATDNNLYSNASEHWKLNMDFVDLELARSYYIGKSLTFRPFFGARGAWIRQALHTRYAGSIAITAAPFSNVVNAAQDTSQRSHSWGVGPRAGLYSNWMIGQGFRLYGNGFADILYTRYKRLGYHETITVVGSADKTFITHQKDRDYLRTHLDLELGIGWGSYFDNNNWHVDLSAGYGFQVFFNQNMFRHYVSSVSVADSNVPNGDLYIQGLTTTLRFDF